MPGNPRLKIAIIGTGISGLSAAWLLNQRHDITVFEKDNRLGGHSNTVDANLAGPNGRRSVPVDTGFIVYNERTYPNLTALFNHLDVATENSVMSFSASMNAGKFEYSGAGITGLLAQTRNLVRPRFWRMVRDILRFYRECVNDAQHPENALLTLGEYLNKQGYSDVFLRDHIYPMASCIWSATSEEIRGYPLTAFVRFFSNHGLLETKHHRRPKWRTVSGGSRSYVDRISAEFSNNILLNSGVVSVSRFPDGVSVVTEDGVSRAFDHVVFAAHSNQALAMLKDPTEDERTLLGSIRYEHNRAVLHSDKSMMPRSLRAWASWNYISAGSNDQSKLVCLTYWMNLLQNIDTDYPVFVTLNPHREPVSSKTIQSFDYEHPIFDQRALDAQKKLWALQGSNRTWYCGAYFGYGFHEDGLQSGLAVAEKLGELKRPWSVENESGRICISGLAPDPITTEAAAYNR
ncbi:MAG: FAD-dependent oxidoreductase [Rhodospirillaceae bacterium]|nr:FAD-dependent oxidoreductase [Rhodospirillaceae bacterium]